MLTWRCSGNRKLTSVTACGTAAVDDLSATARPVTGPARLASGKALAELLESAAAGSFPPPDRCVEILAQPGERDAGVISFTGFAVVFADTDPDWIAGEL